MSRNDMGKLSRVTPVTTSQGPHMKTNSLTPSPTTTGAQMYTFLEKLFPICRSITGDGARQTHRLIKEVLPSLNIQEIPSGTRCFDWTIPPEWNIRDAYLLDPAGKQIANFKKTNLHILNYSTPIDTQLSLEELQDHLYSLPEQPDLIPYTTSYFEKRWGFCLAHNERKALKPGTYRAFIDSSLEPGHLTYSDLVVPGQTEQEILISTYTCHPSLANNETSGPTVATFLAKWLLEGAPHKYTYRFLIGPETLSPIVYLSKHLAHLQKNVIAGFNLTCVGDNRAYSYLPTRQGDTLADRIGKHVLSHIAPDFKCYSFQDRGSDECQYCSPNVNLPVVNLMRSKFMTYPEYHTSADDLDLVSAEGLLGALHVHQRAIESLENNATYKATTICEPQLSRHNLRPSLGATKGLSSYYKNISDILAYSDGQNSLLDIAEIIDYPLWELYAIATTIEDRGLLKRID